MAVLTSEQQINLFAYLPRIPACLSIIGSSLLIYFSIRDKKDRVNRPSYHRILLCMSAFDLISSASMALGTLAVPEEWGLPGLRSIGTTASCTAQGFFAYFGNIAVSIYNACLMLYFVLTIRCGMTEKQIAKKAEPYFHAIAIILPLSVCVTGLALTVFNPSVLFFDNGQFGAPVCLIAPYPILCNTMPEIVGECTRGGNYRVVVLFRLVIYFIVNVVLLSCIALVYWTVRKKVVASRRFVFRSATNASSQESKNSPSEKMLRKVFRQSMLYAIIFFNTFAWATVWSFAGVINDYKVALYYPLIVIVSIFLPLQGFFNFFVFIYPRYKTVRNVNKEKTRKWCLRRKTISTAEQSNGLQAESSTDVNTTPGTSDDDDGPNKIGQVHTDEIEHSPSGSLVIPSTGNDKKEDEVVGSHNLKPPEALVVESV